MVIRVGCQTVAFGPERLNSELVGVLEKVAAIGYEGVEVGARFIADPDGFMRACRDLNLQIAGLHHGGKLWSKEDRTMVVEQFRRVAELAEILSCPRIIASGAGKQGGLSDSELQVQVDTLAQLGGLANKHGAVLLYHNHAWEFENDELVIRAICAGTDEDAVGLAVDLGWAEYAGSDPLQLLKQYGKRIRHVHVRDICDGKFVELGLGCSDVRGIVEELMRMKYDGWTVVEMEPHTAHYGGRLMPSESVAVGFGYLRALCPRT